MNNIEDLILKELVEINLLIDSRKTRLTSDKLEFIDKSYKTINRINMLVNRLQNETIPQIYIIRLINIKNCLHILINQTEELLRDNPLLQVD